MALTIWYGETKQVPFSVKGTDLAFSSPIDPSESILECGFVSANAGEAPPSIWYNGSWDANTLDNIYWGMVLVGPSGVLNLGRGTWTVWAQFTVGAEKIQQPVLDVLYVR